jgi:hypothetical protein
MSGRILEPACITLSLLGKTLSAAEITADPSMAKALRTSMDALVEAVLMVER